MKILIVGGGGYVGTILTEFLLTGLNIGEEFAYILLKDCISQSTFPYLPQSVLKSLKFLDSCFMHVRKPFIALYNKTKWSSIIKIGSEKTIHWKCSVHGGNGNEPS